MQLGKQGCSMSTTDATTTMDVLLPWPPLEEIDAAGFSPVVPQTPATMVQSCPL
jgi:hypothetical protein